MFVLINWQTLAHQPVFYSDQNNKQKRMKNALTEHAIVSPVSLISVFNGKLFGRIKARSTQWDYQGFDVNCYQCSSANQPRFARTYLFINENWPRTYRRAYISVAHKCWPLACCDMILDVIQFVNESGFIDTIFVNSCGAVRSCQHNCFAFVSRWIVSFGLWQIGQRLTLEQIEWNNTPPIKNSKHIKCIFAVFVSKRFISVANSELHNNTNDIRPREMLENTYVFF